MTARTYCADHCVDLNPRDLSSHAGCRVVTEPTTVRRGNWTYVHTPHDGPRWQLDGTTLQLEHDPANRMGGSPNGMWDLYRGSRFVAHVDGYLAGAMQYVEERVAPEAEMIRELERDPEIRAAHDMIREALS